MYKYFLFFLFYLSPFISECSAHPLHLSIINIDYNNDEQNIMIAFKVFISDFENAIYFDNKIIIDATIDSFDGNQIEIVTDYFVKNFELIIDRKKIEEKRYEFVRNSRNDNAVWIYYKIENVKPFSKITISNTIMINFFKDQKNLVILKTEKIEKGFEFNIKNKEETVKIK